MMKSPAFAAEQLREVERPTVAPVPSQRDLRLDLLRGGALLCVLTDHLDGNPLARLTPRNFGVSDMADVLVFVSGYTCGMVYAQVLGNRGFRDCQRKALWRLLQLAAACCGTILLMWAVRFSSAVTHGTGPPVFARGLWDQPAREVSGILLLYGILVAALPIMLLLRNRHWLLLLVPSFAIYCAAQVPAIGSLWQAEAALLTPFNPFAWQLLFVIGVCARSAFNWLEEHALTRISALLAAILVIESLFAARLLGTDLSATLTDKSTLGPVRLLNGVCLCTLAIAVLPQAGHPLWHSFPVRWTVTVGQNGLAVFCLGSVMLALIERTVPPMDPNPAWQVAANFAVWSSCAMLAAGGQHLRSLRLSSRGHEHSHAMTLAGGERVGS